MTILTEHYTFANTRCTVNLIHKFIMRHKLILMSAFILCGCTSKIIDFQPEQKEIGFKVSSPVMTKSSSQVKGLATKASTTYTFDVYNCGFGIMAYNTGSQDWSSGTNLKPNFMWNQQVIKQSTTWKYSPVKYWAIDNSQKISFFAYAPYSVNGEYGIRPSANNVCGAPYLDFTLAAPGSMTDLVANQQINQTGIDSNGKEQSVSFKLSHILCSVVLKAKINKTNIKEIGITSFVYIKRLFLKKSPALCASGRYRFAEQTDSAGVWDIQKKDLSDTDIDLMPILNTAADAKNIDSVSGFRGVYPSVLESTAQELFINDQKLYLIPSNNRQGTANNGDMSIGVEYSIVTFDPNLECGYVVTDNELTIPLPAGALKMNTSYTYTIELSAKNIELKGEEKTWGESKSIS